MEQSSSVLGLLGCVCFQVIFGFFAVRLVVYCTVLTGFFGRSFAQRRSGGTEARKFWIEVEIEVEVFDF